MSTERDRDDRDFNRTLERDSSSCVQQSPMILSLSLPVTGNAVSRLPRTQMNDRYLL